MQGESNIAATTLSYIKIPGVVPPVFSGSVLNSALSAAMTSAGTVYGTVHNRDWVKKMRMAFLL